MSDILENSSFFNVRFGRSEENWFIGRTFVFGKPVFGILVKEAIITTRNNRLGVKKFVSWDQKQLFQTLPVFSEIFSLIENYEFDIRHAYNLIEKNSENSTYFATDLTIGLLDSDKSFHRSSDINRPVDRLGRNFQTRK